MKLIKEHINESIKHLTPRSEEELNIILTTLSDQEIYNLWTRTHINDEEMLYFNILKQRKAKLQLKYIKSTDWYHKRNV